MRKGRKWVEGPKDMRKCCWQPAKLNSVCVCVCMFGCVYIYGCLWQQSSSRFSTGGKLRMRMQMQMRSQMQSPRVHPSGKDTRSHGEKILEKRYCKSDLQGSHEHIFLEHLTFIINYWQNARVVILKRCSTFTWIRQNKLSAFNWLAI